MEASRLSGVSVQTNSQLPIACSDVNNSASVDRPRSHVNITSASCNSWHTGSGVGPGVPRSDRSVTAVKSAHQSNGENQISLHSDAGAAGEHRNRSSKPQMPCYVGCSNVANVGESIIHLRSDFDGEDRQRASESRLSGDGVDCTTVADANPDQDQTSAQLGYLSASCKVTV